MISTTLMTLLLTTNPNVRSVKLLGSWDNFSKQYPMERDKRAGPGHWTGCHTFTDIMGDGPPNDKSQWRTRGLKMGATYWYYYLLDDDVESFNESETVTTQCPLMPGQPMNVLNVPIILPDSRSHVRSTSNSSQKSDYRTMNPEDKFMNPRAPPKKPALGLLQTTSLRRKKSTPACRSKASPIGATMVHRSASQPNSAACRNYGSSDARSVSPTRSRGFRSAFRQINEASSQKRHDVIQQSNAQGLAVLQEAAAKDPPKNPGVTVSSPTTTSETSTPATIQSRRAMKTDGDDTTPKRNPLTVDTRFPERNASLSRHTGAGKSDGENSDPSTPTAADLKEKRLPSLPNTPSSVMDEAVRAIDERDKALIDKVPQSHFSSLTIDDSLNSRVGGEESRFSEWSTDTENNSPEATFLASTFNREKHKSPAVDNSWRTPDLSQPTDTATDTATDTNTDPNTPHLTVNSKPSSPNSASGDIPPWNMSLPELTVSLSSPNPDAAGLGIENIDEMVESNPKRHAALFSAIESMQALALARSRSGSPIMLPEVQRQSGAEAKEGSGNTLPVGGDTSSSSLRGQRTMQELMDELSYLKNLIQAEMDGSPF